MSAMQNYAKFDSRVSSESLNMVQDSSFKSYSWGTGSSVINNIFDLIHTLLQFIIWAIITITIIFIAFLFLYIIVSLFTKWWEKTMLELNWIWNNFKKNLIKFYNYVVLAVKKWFNYLWSKKSLTALIIVWLFLLSFIFDVFSWQSRYLKVIKIDTWYVWVDLKNKEILQPGYHLYSPIYTNVFLSPTNDFDFEIAEVTANTKEELTVTLDYRVWFKLIDEKRLSFYTKYGAKNIQLVSSDIVMPKLLEALKWTIRNYSFKDISSKHSEIKSITLKAANKVLNEIWVDLQDITILDIRLPSSYLTSKEDLLKSDNELKLAEARLETQKRESEKQLLEAKNKKDVKIIEAEAIAEYNRIVKSNPITNDMLELKELENQTIKINKWDWKLPATVWDNLVF